MDLGYFETEIHIQGVDTNALNQEIARGVVAKEMKEEDINYYSQVHILVSLPVGQYMEAKDIIEKLKKIKGVEIEQGAN